MTNDTTDIQSEAGREDQGGLLAELIRLVLPILFGLGLAVAIHYLILLPRLGFPADVRRPIAIGTSLHSKIMKSSDPVAVIISNSAGVEGIDASIVQQAAPKGWKVLNYSANGTNQVEARMLADQLADAGAELVIWLMRPDMLGTPRPMHSDVLFAYAEGGLASKSNWVGPPWMDKATASSLAASQFEISMHFRRRWLDAINYKMRRRMRTGIRTPDPADFDTPFNLEIVLDGALLDRHLGEISTMMSEELPGFKADGPGSGRAFIREMIDDFANRETALAIVVAPTHPALQDQFQPLEDEVVLLLEPMAGPKGLLVGTAAGVLKSSEYADAIHPNATGRVRLSTWIGKWMPPPPPSTDHRE